MANRTAHALVALYFSLSACGASLESPESLRQKVYAVGAEKMTFVMLTCSNVCVSYGEAACSVALDAEAERLEVDISVSMTQESTQIKIGGKYYDDEEKQKMCGIVCGPTIYAHCPLPDLSAGKYQVVAGSFDATIEVR